MLTHHAILRRIVASPSGTTLEHFFAFRDADTSSQFDEEVGSAIFGLAAANSELKELPISQERSNLVKAQRVHIDSIEQALHRLGSSS